LEQKNIFNQKSTQKILLISAIIFILVFLFFYPKFYYFPDEHQYLRNSYLFANNYLKIFDPLKAYGYPAFKDFFVSKYVIGPSILFLPLTLINWQLSFLTGLLLHLASFYIFILILRELKINEIFSLLFLFFPAFVFFSRTLMSETASVLFILLGFYYWLKNKSFLSGIIFGFSIFLRLTNILIFVPFLLFSLRDFNKTSKAIAGFLILATAFVFFNFQIFETIFPSYSFLDAQNLWNFVNIPFKFIMFIITTNILYPLMFLVFFFYKGKFSLEMKTATILMLVFYLPYYGQPFKLSISDFFTGIRYWIPIIPFFLISYAKFLHDNIHKFKLSELHLKFAVIGMILILITGTVVISFQHSKITNDRFEVFEEIYSKTNENSLIISDPIGTGIAYKTKDSPFNTMFFSEWFGSRNVVPISDSKEYIDDFSDVYYLKTYFEGSKLKLELRKFNKAQDYD